MIVAIKKQYGFHLLEMLAVLSLVSILAVIGYTSYSHYLLRAARIEVVIQLNQMSMMLEKGYLEQQAYDAVSLPTSQHNKHYVIEIAKINKEYYELMARPISRLAKEHPCGALTLDAEGTKHATGSAALDSCW